MKNFLYGLLVVVVLLVIGLGVNGQLTQGSIVWNFFSHPKTSIDKEIPKEMDSGHVDINTIGTGDEVEVGEDSEEVLDFDIDSDDSTIEFELKNGKLEITDEGQEKLKNYFK